MPIRESPNLVNQLTTLNCLYQTVTQTLAQSLCGYKCVICTCTAPMCCHGVCVQGLHSTGHLQHPTQELAIRLATLTIAVLGSLDTRKHPSTKDMPKTANGLTYTASL